MWQSFVGEICFALLWGESHVCALWDGGMEGRRGGARETIQGFWSFWKRCRMNGIESRSRARGFPPAPRILANQYLLFPIILFYLFCFRCVFFFLCVSLIHHHSCSGQEFVAHRLFASLPLWSNEKRSNGNIGVVDLKREGGRGCAVTPLAGSLIKSITPPSTSDTLTLPNRHVRQLIPLSSHPSPMNC